ncbi:MAG TPA: biotin/lipoyl-binding protein, partial [Geobacterales bacterium]|nr:biotin/lipoyl-binding protein [Geobacterales bacterium]
MKRPPKAVLIALLIAGGLAGAWWYKTRHVGTGELVLQGNVEVRQVNLGFKVPGRIETLNVDEGDRVRTGQVLASLDKIYFQD